MTARYIQCRMLKRNGEQCTAEALDQAPDAWAHICAGHAAKVMKLVREQADRAKLTRTRATARR